MDERGVGRTSELARDQRIDDTRRVDPQSAESFVRALRDSADRMTDPARGKNEGASAEPDGFSAGDAGADGVRHERSSDRQGALETLALGLSDVLEAGLARSAGDAPLAGSAADVSEGDRQAAEKRLAAAANSLSSGEEASGEWTQGDELLAASSQDSTADEMTGADADQAGNDALSDARLADEDSAASAGVSIDDAAGSVAREGEGPGGTVPVEASLTEAASLAGDERGSRGIDALASAGQGSAAGSDADVELAPFAARTGRSGAAEIGSLSTRSSSSDGVGGEALQIGNASLPGGVPVAIESGGIVVVGSPARAVDSASLAALFSRLRQSHLATPGRWQIRVENGVAGLETVELSHSEEGGWNLRVGWGPRHQARSGEQATLLRDALQMRGHAIDELQIAEVAPEWANPESGSS